MQRSCDVANFNLNAWKFPFLSFHSLTRTLATLMSIPASSTKKTMPVASPSVSTQGTRDSYADSSLEQKTNSQRLQEENRRLIHHELQDRVFQSNDLPPEPLFRIAEHRVQWEKSLDDLVNSFFVEGRPRAGNDIQKLVDLKKAGTSSYPHVVSIVNAICDSATPGEGFFSQYRLGVYDREMQGKVSGAHPMKPDFWFCDKRLIHNGRLRERVFFSNEFLGFPGEGKGDSVEDGIVRGTSYMRPLLLCGRWYSLFLAYSNSDQSIRFCFTLPSGLYVTPRWTLSEPSTFRRVAEVFYAFQHMSAYQVGLHPYHAYYRDTQCFRIPKSPSHSLYFHLNSVLYEKSAVVGRRTLVGQASCTDIGNLDFASTDSSQSSHSPNHSRQTRSVTAQSTAFELTQLKEALTNVEDSLVNPPAKISTLQLGYELQEVVADDDSGDGDSQDKIVKPLLIPPPVPTTLDGMFIFPATSLNDVPPFVQEGDVIQPNIFRRSFPLASHVKVELAAINSAPGAHGLPQVAGHMVFPHYFNAFESLSVVRCPGLPERWYSSEVLRVEPRVELWLFTDTAGEPLTVCKTPRELARCFQDAICGHYHLFQRGFIHGDVSFGNILKHKIVEIRNDSLKALNAQLLIQWIGARSPFLDTCEAFIHDTDLVIDWRDVEHQASHSKSGTPQFISRRLLHLWARNQQFTHTAVDDLESMIWVGAWVALHKEPDDECRDVIEAFCEDDVKKLESSKNNFVTNLRNDSFASKPIRQIRPLLLKWLKIVDDLKFQTGTIGVGEVLLVYEKFIAATDAFVASDDFARVWGDIGAKPVVIREEVPIPEAFGKKWRE